ncbi:MAG TPA: hypothetical protein VG125_16110 [Pirellulales bacterium]|jgi:hypothetical protein|nr:hypothetical protein [Pirellulales bacterium]
MSDFKASPSAGLVTGTTAKAVVEGFLATVLDIVVAAWPHVCDGTIDGTTPEDDITNKLRWAMDAEKLQRVPPPALRFERETQRDDPNRRFATGLIDIYVVYSWDLAEYIAMECKKVNDCHETPAKKYIEEGVCRFSTGKYSPNHPFGAMVGYVTRGTTDSTAQFLGAKIVAFDRKVTGLVAKWGWRSETRFGAIPNLHSTQHRQLRTTNTILLVHLFLALPCKN